MEWRNDEKVRNVPRRREREEFNDMEWIAHRERIYTDFVEEQAEEA